jgi:hypothetical protein
MKQKDAYREEIPSPPVKNNNILFKDNQIYILNYLIAMAGA